MLKAIRDRFETRPFVPFTVVTSAGKQYFVASTEHASFNPNGTALTIYFDDDGSVYLSALHLAAIGQADFATTAA